MAHDPNVHCLVLDGVKYPLQFVSINSHNPGDMIHLEIRQTGLHRMHVVPSLQHLWGLRDSVSCETVCGRGACRR